ncbi:MAG: amidotransferase [Gammaproteobacteria bacterium]
MRIHYLQHVPAEGLGAIEDWAQRKGAQLSVTRLYENDALPEPDGFDWLIIMGGPMNIYEESDHSWLIPEKRFIHRAIEAGKVVLGFCLGAQLIADALGARVTRNPETEIGWFEVTPVDSVITSPLDKLLDQPVMAFHWHGDRFEMPPEAQLFAHSEACAHQGFVYDDRVYAFQFHAEVTPKVVATFIEAEGALPYGPYIQTPEAMLADTAPFESMNQRLFAFLDGLADRHS